jgi:hypothetical protein
LAFLCPAQWLIWLLTLEEEGRHHSWHPFFLWKCSVSPWLCLCERAVCWSVLLRNR